MNTIQATASSIKALVFTAVASVPKAKGTLPSTDSISYIMYSFNVSTTMRWILASYGHISSALLTAIDVATVRGS